MKFSVVLVSLGLCATSVIADSFATVTFKAGDDTWNEDVASGECNASEEPNSIIQEIDITSDSSDVKCTFYTDEDCRGDKYTLKEGTHTFKKDFYAASFSCV